MIRHQSEAIFTSKIFSHGIKRFTYLSEIFIILTENDKDRFSPVALGQPRAILLFFLLQLHGSISRLFDFETVKDLEKERKS